MATHSPGSTRASVWFSSDKRSGPGRSSTVSVGARSLSRTSVRFWRSRVGSPLTSRNCVACVTGIEDDHECRRQLQRDERLFAGRQLDQFEDDFLDQLLEIVRDIDARTPEHLTKILVEWQFVGVVRRDPADPPVDRKRHLDDLVEGRRVSGCAPGAGIFILVDALQRRGRIEHTPATGAQDVPRQLEDPEPRRVQKGGDHAFLVEPGLRGEIQHVDPAERAIRSIPNQLLDSVGRLGISRLPQNRKQISGFAHRPVLSRMRHSQSWRTFATRPLRRP